jgi:GNAT superfamily N-acetyltransferase
MDASVMDLKFRKAEANDLKLIHELQIKCFADLLSKYQDYETNPAAEPIQKIIDRYNQPQTTYFLIESDGDAIGAIRIVLNSEQHWARISPIFILPEFQNSGLGKASMEIAESLFPKVKIWYLDTIAEETHLIRFYESLGYKKLDRTENIKPGMNLAFFEKRMETC